MFDYKLVKVIKDFIKVMSINLPDDVLKRLGELRDDEKKAVDNKLGSDLYDCIFDNLDLAKKFNRPICQDTGFFQFFVKVGVNNRFLNFIEDSIIEALKECTSEIPLRPNVVLPFSDNNTGNNIGVGAPFIEWELIKDSDILEIGVYSAGGGCSLPGRSKVLMPLEGIEGIKNFVYDTILDWGVNACPPLIVGVGIGTCATTSAILSKQALMEDLYDNNINNDLNIIKLEKELQDGLDKIGIAPLGFGGCHSVLGVKVKASSHHPATLGVSISTGCWATRRGKLIINDDYSYDYPMHKRLLNKENK